MRFRQTLIATALACLSTSAMAQEQETMAAKVIGTNGKLLYSTSLDGTSITFDDEGKQMNVKKDGMVSKTIALSEVSKIVLGELSQTETSLPDAAPTEFSVYASNTLRARCTSGIVSLKIYDTAGHLISTTTYDDLPTEVETDLSQLGQGMYIAVAQSKDAKATQKFSIKN